MKPFARWFDTLRQGVARVLPSLSGATAFERGGRRDEVRRPSAAPAPAPRRPYPGDYRGPLTLSYAPHPDEIPDPGEVVWTWVPFEEDYRHGKDRPVLIIARENENWMLGLMLSSKDHDLDKDQEAHEGRYWIEIGSGPWDTSGRKSAVRVNRVVRVDPHGVRRIGGRLDELRFNAVAAAVELHAREA